MDFKTIFVIRFSSFGDIVQTMASLAPLKEKFPEAKIHWITKKEFVELIQLNPMVDQAHGFDSKTGLSGLFTYFRELLKLQPDLIYDAHNNIRSLLARLYFGLKSQSKITFITRSKERWKRLLLFSFRINTYSQWPIKGMITFINPLKQIGIDQIINTQNWNWPAKCQELLHRYPVLKQPFIAIAPSAAWEMKRWPMEHWKKLLSQWKAGQIVILGGPDDHFCNELLNSAPAGTLNLAGKLNLVESCYVVSQSQKLICADTGLLHVADLLGRPALALIGPTAFGHPNFANVISLQNPRPLPCRPCSKDGRGKCVREIYQECMVGITPEQVQENI